MKGMIDIPEGLTVPENEGEMFTVPVEFAVMHGMLLPVAIDGIDLPAPEEEMPEQEAPEEEMSEEEMPEGGGFMAAIEKEMGGGKR